MDDRTIARLHSLNEQFYQTFGSAFSSTRMRLQPGVRKILADLNGSENILDLGCGNGGLANELLMRGHRGRYVGLDFSPVLLGEAGKIARNDSISFIQADLLGPDWVKQIAGTGINRFDCVTAFAVLHHIPGRGARQRILSEVRSLLHPGGIFHHSEWQFLNSEKWKARVQPWEEAGLSREEVEVDDYLLDWRSGGRGLRYVHHFSEAELSSLAEDSGFRVLKTFLSDGSSDNLSIYQSWEAI